jgi:glycosyltransferase involved in cell wall biosynthesis
MHILICHERFLFRFGADRVLILLGSGLKQNGHTVSIMANRYDTEIVKRFADRVIDVPETAGRYLHLNEDVAQWLVNNWHALFDPDTRPDVIIVGGWPFFAAIPFFRKVCPNVVFVDFGAVPLEGYSDGMLVTQEKVRQLRKTFLKHATQIVAISKFILHSQSVNDAGPNVPATAILLGADHIDSAVWASANLTGATRKHEALAVVNALRASDKKLVLVLGRWEPGCYKNSEAAMPFLRELRNRIPNAVALILEMAPIETPDDLKDAIYAIGFPDDAELSEIMQRVDLGVSLSLWEGFNLPLAEMQWLDRPVLAFAVGAHPEVVAHPWFLCADVDEMAAKAVEVLSGGGLTPKVQEDARSQFRKHFTWQRAIGEYERLLSISGDSRISLIIDVTNSTRDPANSGVVRVTRRFGRELQLQRYERPLFVVWDSENCHYVLPTRAEFLQLSQFNGPLLSSDSFLSPVDTHRVTLEAALQAFGMKNPWLLFTETMIEVRFKRIRQHVRSLGLRCAAIFYDAIPVLCPDLCNEEMRNNHSDYMRGLAECDMVVPISEYSGKCLEAFWREHGVHGCRIDTNVLPGEFGGADRVSTPTSNTGTTRIVCVSTLEPRKNHRRLLAACELLEQQHPDLNWSLTLIGNRYAGAFEIAEYVEKVSARNPRVRWVGIVDDATLHELYEQCTFTVYPSIIEGFGMPIVESMWHGKPCLCSDQGVMAELAQPGGCLTTDVSDEAALADSIARLATDRVLLEQLSQQALGRSMKTWDDYVREFRHKLAVMDSSSPSSSAAAHKLSSATAPAIPWSDILYPRCLLDNWQMHDSERLALTAVLARSRPTCAIEVGTYHGGSLSLISQYAEMVFSIDIDPAVVARAGHMKNVSFLTGRSDEILPRLLEELDMAGIAPDFVLIDGDHSAEGVKRDASIVLNYVPKKAMIVLLHDSFNPGCRRGMLETAWHTSPYCHAVEIDFVPGRVIEHDGPSKGELWGGLAFAYFAPTPRTGPLKSNRSAETLFQVMNEQAAVKMR